MKTYQFNYSVVPTDNSWWCEIRKQSFVCKADDLKKANEMFIAHMDDKWCVTISKSAAKKPRKMYRESTKGDYQCGLVYKGSMEIEGTIKSWVRKYADIWCEITTQSTPDELVNFGVM